MKFITFQRRADSLRGGLLLESNRVMDLGLGYSSKALKAGKLGDDTAGFLNSLRGVSSSILEIIRIGEEALTDCYELQRMADDGDLEECLYPVGEVTMAAPIPDPPVVVVFNSFEKHARAEFEYLQQGKCDLPPAWYQYPSYFFANPLAVAGTGTEVVFPEGETGIDFELHVAAVTSEDVHQAGPEDAEAAILGYTAAIVWVARSNQRNNFVLGNGFASAKAFQINMCPCLVTKDEMPEPDDLAYKVAINGYDLADDHPPTLHFSFAEMISFASERTRIPAGSLFLSGGMPGVGGLHTGQFLRTGDKIVIGVEEAGRLLGAVHSRLAPQVYVPRDLPTR